MSTEGKKCHLCDLERPRGALTGRLILFKNMFLSSMPRLLRKLKKQSSNYVGKFPYPSPPLYAWFVQSASTTPPSYTGLRTDSHAAETRLHAVHYIPNLLEIYTKKGEREKR
ncbi:hypothetical protein EVAR_68721_1 [Eumeta japonica]|uniref:Uncharacterized protein n=1 Tax=Eumeta variegata TaxID=151549 RepID=A0A4C2A5B2_EUMVA|nr:hypothetical protein EVAR_68721_1 [Eumeta japonica]